MVTSNGPVSRILNPGGTMRYNSSPYPYFYSETVQPQLTTVEYDFFNPGEIFDYGLQTWTKPVLPGMVFFSTSNHSQKFLAAVGSTIHIAGYAKMAIQNGNAGVYAYLGQYFTNAYKMDGNGNATTNTTGMVSPYGDFFATEPGQAAYITMPDLNTGVRGTCAVSCVSLNVDANHDGVMDVAFNGADRTSLVNPMRFWVNNGYTRANGDVQVSGDIPRNYSLGNMTGAPDLENFASLWVCGMPTLVTNQGYAVTLNWQNISGSPAINLYASVETNGGTTYLTDTNIAAQQSAITLVGNPPMSYTVTGIGKAIVQIASGQTFTIPASYFTNSGNKYFLCEGAGIGSGELVLKILQNGTNILQTSVWLDLHDVKDLYEQADVTNVTTGLPPSSLVSQYRIDHVTAAAPDETKQVIVFVHGINNTQFDYSSSTETMFKRLYWSGYHGKVAGFKWPCAYLPFENSINPFNYNKGEFYAWKSASAFKDYLTYLHNRTDLTNYTLNILAHSQGNVVASEAVKQGAPFDNYILSQGAIPAQCYDTSVSFQQKFLTAEAGTPTPLNTTNGGYHGYFANVTGNLINFYNTNDYALAKGTWLGLQANWGKNHVSQNPESFVLAGC